MPNRVNDLNIFLQEMINLLQLCSRCREVLFRIGFRKNLNRVTDSVVTRLRELSEDKRIRFPDQYTEMQAAGLTGAQLHLKLESFESALIAFESEAGLARLEETLDKGGTILSSLAGAIPGFGSFAQELVEFLLKELRKRMKWWPW